MSQFNKLIIAIFIIGLIYGNNVIVVDLEVRNV